PYLEFKASWVQADACYFSPHKFPGGHSTPGVLIVRRSLLKSCALACGRKTPTTPCGGTVEKFCSASGGPKYSNDIEIAEQGGTMNIVGAIRIAIVLDLFRGNYARSISHHGHALARLGYELFRNLERTTQGRLRLLNPPK
ncbi:hypothetical protein HDU93_003907, partial [Gonapodya sp. JEL0774]